MKLTLPTDSDERKRYPIFRGALRYFPAALAGVGNISLLGNEKHNPGEEMHHARGKSTDHADCIVRHLMDAADMEAANARNPNKGGEPFTPEQILTEGRQMAWRALAFLQEMEERYGAPLAPGAREKPVESGAPRAMPVPARLHTSWCKLDRDHPGACRNEEKMAWPNEVLV